ncbi:intradiol ring-cleavage dioxygenase [Hyphomicrobium sp. LHD-15]|uniref:intradiol ring-cleavage dioxygenase n=1 Tax=Hyphomicrobium sp. LHD-15 TaxID=3072142 RepID=UPI00280D6567|nr:intradiol ring-cleavage dioxygenase [Hyphomicrobium sp. LHD-15]MDQ8697121.1 intradiol ring-cleavage dioxygenase [Hyphomicrobium sp. LHD-15]
MTEKTNISRRSALAGIAGSAAVLAGERKAAAASPATAPAIPAAANVCRMTPRMVEGPFYFDPALLRAEITEGRPGVPLKLVLQVVEGATCQPISGARVDVWHCDATGQYSGYPGQGDGQNISTKGEKFLRGTQMTGATGEVTFASIYPGWYRGRTTHIHFKVLLDEKAMLTGQMYFPDALSEYIFANVPPYNARAAKRDTLNSTDWIAGADGDHISFVSVREEADGYVATLIIGVNPAAEPEKAGFGRPPGPPPGAGGPPPGGPPPGMEGGPTRQRGKGSIVPGSGT